MKSVHTLSFVLLIAVGCWREDAHNNNIQVSDSTRRVSTERELEEAVRNYYVSVERDLRTDLGVSEAEVIERVQSLIDDGYVKKPVIFLITENGPKWETVDYPTYKEFMSDHAVAFRRFHGIQPNIRDSLVIDSIRSSLLKALKADTLRGD